MSEVKPWEEAPDDGYWQAMFSKGDVPAGSKAAPASSEGWALAEKSYTDGDILELRVVGYNRGGLLVDLGDTRGFVPSSQLAAFPRHTPEDQRMQELAHRVGSSLRLKVIEFDRSRNRLILSERVANPPVSHTEQLLATIEPQQTRNGVVRNVTDFGAFVDLGGVEGLVHVSELSWQYVKHPRDVLSPGQEVQVYIMEVNREQKRIACSIKRLTSNPWVVAAEKLRPGDTVDGVITSIVPFGAFVRVADGVEGLVHVSEMADTDFQHPRDIVKEGQAVQVRVMDIDPDQQRLRLSLRLNGSADAAPLNHESSQAQHKVPPPPPPDPGYWENLAQLGM